MATRKVTENDVIQKMAEIFLSRRDRGPARLIGGSNQSGSGDHGFVNPMTSPGDLIRGGEGGGPVRLPIGTDGHVLTVVSGLPSWQPGGGGGGMSNPMTSVGDLIVGGTSGDPQRLGIGSSGQVLTVVSGSPAWQTINRTMALEWTLSEGGVPTIGEKHALIVPFDATITAWYILADQSGDLTLDFWKKNHASGAPTNSDSITASAKPSLSSARRAASSSLTGWTTSIAAFDWITLEVESASTIGAFTVALIISVT